ncbi:MAG TPA: tetratricopeptide repeat protein [Burkholderiaceae bacterium]|nr:tetratricopeptide repeat protein [Burkholderiaceae bacterium]
MSFLVIRRGVAGLLSGLVLVAAAHAADATLDQVYDAVHAGRLADAEAMMAQVLRDHPNSAKAHYVEAEVLAREGRRTEANAELRRAESIEPGLRFVKSESVEALRGMIAGGAPGRASVVQAPPAAGVPWMPLLLAGGAIVLLVAFFRARRRAAVSGPPGSGYATYGGGAPPYGPQGPQGPYGPAPMGPTGAMGGGLGSGILGGLATGAAVGAGMMAGEALARDVIEGHARSRDASSWGTDAAAPAARDEDAGGRDFGIQDSGSWDDGGGGGGDGGFGGGSDDWS